MKPRTQEEVADFIKRSLEPFDGQVVNPSKLTAHLTKMLTQLMDRRRKPAFEVEVKELLPDGRMTVTIDVKDPRLVQKLEDLQGRHCRDCYGKGRLEDILGFDEGVCSTCKGVGRIPL